MESINLFRRKALMMGMATPLLVCFPRIVLAEELVAEKPIEVNVEGVTNVKSLIRAMRTAAGGLLPDSIKDSEFRAEIARVFVKNARAAAEQGYKVPKWVLERLHLRKVVFPFLGLATFFIAGILFTVPVSTIIIAVLASMAIMTVAVTAAIGEAVKPTNKKA